MVTEADERRKPVDGYGFSFYVEIMEWKISQQPVDYAEAVAFMEARVAAISAGEKDECIWLLEHPDIYTAGTSANPSDLIDARFPVVATGRGGQYTYHGPGQRIAYVMRNLRGSGRQPDLKAYIHTLEEWLIQSLKELGIRAERRIGRVGLWVETDGREEKIAAIGVRVRKWVTYHGVAINNDPALEKFSGIVPCGLPSYGVTSIEKLGVRISRSELDKLLKEQWVRKFS